LTPFRKAILATPLVLGGGVTALGFYMHPAFLKNPSNFFIGYRRYIREVVAAAKIGLSYKWAGDNITSELHTKNARIMYEMMKTNGGIFIKAGQQIAQLESLVPDEWIQVLEPMQMAAPTTSFERVKRVVEEDLGKPLDQVFSEFCETPVASASLAQVHKARLRETGEIVAVKVQHP